MTLDEAIKHCEEVAEESEYSAIMFKQKKEVSAFLEKAEAEKAENDCQQCAADHRQLAEWLKELKERRAADVKRGKWIEKAEDYYRQWQDSGRSWDDMPYFITGLHFACGVCFDKYEINAEGVEFWDFCPHCGADMRGEDNADSNR